MRNPVLFIFLLIGILVIGIVVNLFLNSNTPEPVANFEECVRAGNPVMESYPRQCRTEDGLLFVEEIDNPVNQGNAEDKSDLIRVSTPKPNDTVGNSFFVEGEARGYWFFEANLPYTVVDENEHIIGTGSFTATDEWMTEDFVSFSGTTTFDIPENATNGTFIIHKDNPSGKEELDDELRIPLTFDANMQAVPIVGDCRETGCGGQLCADKETPSTCEYREVYSCYQDYGVCERQADGACGWTQTEELLTCIAEKE